MVQWTFVVKDVSVSHSAPRSLVTALGTLENQVSSMKWYKNLYNAVKTLSDSSKNKFSGHGE